MHMIFAVLSVLFVIAGFVGLFFGVVPTIVCWILAGVCIGVGWRARPVAQRRREDRLAGPHAT